MRRRWPGVHAVGMRLAPAPVLAAARQGRRCLLLALALLPMLAAGEPPTPATEAGGTEASAASDSAGIRARLATPPVLRGQFEQRKQLKGFRNPLLSRGDFLLVRERGVAWDTREPFASTTLLTRDRLLSVQPDGSQRVMVDSAQSPGMAAVNALLMALVAGDLDALAPQFSMAPTLLPDGTWRLRLLPREPALARLFRSIELAGDRHVREVLIEETAGDRTTLRFLGLDEQAAATAAEAARFD